MGYELVSPLVSKVPVSKDTIVKDIIKQCFINRSQHSYNPEWETIKARVNKACFESIDINIKEDYEKAYQLSIQCLQILHYWYYKSFTLDTREALINVPINLLVSNSTINAQIDIVLLDNKYGAIPIVFSNGLSPNSLYNNIETKGLLWLLYTQLEKYPTKYEYLVINERVVDTNILFAKSDSIDRIGKYIVHIVKSIESQVFYPSVSEACNSCRFSSICTI